jgi:serine/threonine protein kinase
VHRDVKPSNIMLTRSGIVKVTDLGLGSLDERRFSTREKLTQSGQLMRTLDFMAPEQAPSSHVKLRTLYLLKTKVTPAAVERFQSIRKRCQVLLTSDSKNDGPSNGLPSSTLLRRLVYLASWTSPLSSPPGQAAMGTK